MRGNGGEKEFACPSSEQGEQKVEAAAMEDKELLGCRSPDFSLL